MLVLLVIAVEDAVHPVRSIREPFCKYRKDVSVHQLHDGEEGQQHEVQDAQVEEDGVEVPEERNVANEPRRELMSFDRESLEVEQAQKAVQRGQQRKGQLTATLKDRFVCHVH